MEGKIGAAAEKAHEKLSSGAGHNECVNKLASKLHDDGVHFEHEKSLTCDGNVCKPDITVVNQKEGKDVAYVEVKCKNKTDQGDREQAEKYRDAGGAPAFLVNMKGDKPEPNVRKFE